MTLLALAAVTLAGVVATSSDSFDPGPIPTCNGEQATIVGVAQGTDSDYDAWAAQGVDIQSNEDELFVGTTGHDVMVALVSTNSGGLVSDPFPASPTNQVPTDGDSMCSFLTKADDVYYASRGRGDFIFDAGGSDDYYLGGCKLDGEGVPGDRACDTMIDIGPPGSLAGEFSSDSDSTWTFFVPKGRTTRLTETEAMNHNYVGLGPGKVVVDGGDCLLRTASGSLVSCVGRVPFDGVHVHPCPRTEVAVDFGLEIKKFQGITAINIEYFGPEPIEVAIDPCAYQATSL